MTISTVVADWKFSHVELHRKALRTGKILIYAIYTNNNEIAPELLSAWMCWVLLCFVELDSVGVKDSSSLCYVTPSEFYDD